MVKSKIRNSTKRIIELKLIEIKGRATKFHKFIITFWTEVVSQLKNESPAATQLADITDLEVTQYYFV